MSAPLDAQQAFLLDWLSKEDTSALGECKGAALSGLVHLGLAEIGPIPRGYTDPNYRRVKLTDAGWQRLATERETAKREHDFPSPFSACTGCGKHVEELMDQRYCAGGAPG